MDLKTLYREVILDHYKQPRNTRELAEPSSTAACRNPSCGDRISVQLRVRDGSVEEVAFLGVGCAVSQASASMMTEAIKGKPVGQVEQILRAFRAMVVEARPDPDKAVLGDLVTLESVAKLHARVKCAMCGWSALEAALEHSGADVNLDDDMQMPASSRA